MKIGGAGAALGRVAAAVAPAVERPQPTKMELVVKALLSHDTQTRDEASLVRSSRRSLLEHAWQAALLLCTFFLGFFSFLSLVFFLVFFLPLVCFPLRT